MKKITLLITALWLVLSQSLFANTYVGIGIASTEFDDEIQDYSEINVKGLIGVKIDDKIAFEAHYLNIAGDIESPLAPSSKFDVDGYSFGVSGLYYFYEDKLFAKLGLHQWESDVNALNSSNDGIDLFFGLGYEAVLNSFRLRLEYENFELGDNIDDKLTSFSISAVWGF